MTCGNLLLGGKRTTVQFIVQCLSGPEGVYDGSFDAEGDCLDFYAVSDNVNSRQFIGTLDLSNATDFCRISCLIEMGESATVAALTDVKNL